MNNYFCEAIRCGIQIDGLMAYSNDSIFMRLMAEIKCFNAFSYLWLLFWHLSDYSVISLKLPSVQT